MPITKSAHKALRQSKRKAIVNRRVKNAVKQAIRLFKKSPTLANLKKLYSVLDKAAKKNIFHKNKAARLKSRLAKKVQPIRKTTKKVKQSRKRRASQK